MSPLGKGGGLTETAGGLWTLLLQHMENPVRTSAVCTPSPCLWDKNLSALHSGQEKRLGVRLSRVWALHWGRLTVYLYFRLQNWGPEAISIVAVRNLLRCCLNPGQTINATQWISTSNSCFGPMGIVIYLGNNMMMYKILSENLHTEFAPFSSIIYPTTPLV